MKFILKKNVKQEEHVCTKETENSEPPKLSIEEEAESLSISDITSEEPTVQTLEESSPSDQNEETQADSIPIPPLVITTKEDSGEESIDEVRQADAIEPKELPDNLSLPTNQSLIDLMEEIVEIIDEFDGFHSRLQTEEGRSIARLAVDRLFETLERNGLERIDSDQLFSILRHTPEPMALVEEGRPIKQILSFGLVRGNRVFRKAKVQVQTRV